MWAKICLLVCSISIKWLKSKKKTSCVFNVYMCSPTAALVTVSHFPLCSCANLASCSCCCFIFNRHADHVFLISPQNVILFLLSVFPSSITFFSLIATHAGAEMGKLWFLSSLKLKGWLQGNDTSNANVAGRWNGRIHPRFHEHLLSIGFCNRFFFFCSSLPGDGNERHVGLTRRALELIKSNKGASLLRSTCTVQVCPLKPWPLAIKISIPLLCLFN